MNSLAGRTSQNIINLIKEATSNMNATTRIKIAPYYEE